MKTVFGQLNTGNTKSRFSEIGLSMLWFICLLCRLDNPKTMSWGCLVLFTRGTMLKICYSRALAFVPNADKFDTPAK